MSFFNGNTESQDCFEKGQEMAKEHANTLSHEAARDGFLQGLSISDQESYKEGFDSVANKD